MKSLLYIGNKLSDHGYTSTSIETLGAFLEEESFHVYYASSQKNKVWRMFDMIIKTIKYAKKVDYVLIDWGIPYLLEQNVNLLLVDDDDDDDDDGMTNQIKHLFTEPNLALNLSKKGKKSVERFDWEIVKKAMD